MGVHSYFSHVVVVCLLLSYELMPRKFFRKGRKVTWIEIQIIHANAAVLGEDIIFSFSEQPEWI